MVMAAQPRENEKKKKTLLKHMLQNHEFSGTYVSI